LGEAVQVDAAELEVEGRPDGRRFFWISTMRAPLLTTLFAICVISCARAPLPRDAGVATAETCPDGPLYFPEGVVPEDSGLPLRRHMSAFLDRLGEPSLWCGAHQADEEYRLTLEETWTDPRAIRVSRTGNEYTLDVVVMEGPGGFVLGPVKARYARALTQAEWRQITDAIDELGFWRMTTNLENLLGNDGTVWTIEGRRDGRYQYVGRWQGADGVESAGQAFVALDRGA
jgi:hypothetical protein